ncbi:MAG TPA: CDP-diacylglycerol--glycerol-3-phosphate 3-phosphatidyltransferase, partial [Burkholderiales bacterium]|nr:CDP-diacylglycerol--glycerol-3-phosphate 3-phosphatidyltransferase [Burkholderiales bacterium]
VVATAIFVFASLTDWLDGYLARKKGLVTVIGQLLDPTADKLLITSAIVCLVKLGRIPAWAAVIIIGRELAVSGFRAIASSRGLNIPASGLGKAKMGLESWAVGALILGPFYFEKLFGKVYILAQVGLYLVIVTALASAAEYYIRYGRQVLSKQS